ncbi:28S ribosomal protein S17, mitochondrial [Venturia canescens]|uniref:28S ribosomal protein S17, mitochondrial n=1 Tax=Venturia canescens TaxID=32260 RepID=UPI001C9D04CA|nr:28S ribosomal protein S17, mitochondrial [Venturia canescens]XP_043280814.1 28S ribosomal protein S17, mitochondrial [Venturia canescens]
MASVKTAATAKQAVKYFLAQCVPTTRSQTSRFRIKLLEFDENLRMYFNSYKFVFAYDPQKLCKTGDTVLIQSLPEKMTRLITHKVIEVVYPLGDITDPITGKKAVVGRFREDIKAINELYGESPNAFDYDKEPPRGKTEGKRDFTHRTPGVKYHEDPDEDSRHLI